MKIHDGGNVLYVHWYTGAENVGWILRQVFGKKRKKKRKNKHFHFIKKFRFWVGWEPVSTLSFFTGLPGSDM